MLDAATRYFGIARPSAAGLRAARSSGSRCHARQATDRASRSRTEAASVIRGGDARRRALRWRRSRALRGTRRPIASNDRSCRPSAAACGQSMRERGASCAPSNAFHVLMAGGVRRSRPISDARTPLCVRARTRDSRVASRAPCRASRRIRAGGGWRGCCSHSYSQAGTRGRSSIAALAGSLLAPTRPSWISCPRLLHPFPLPCWQARS